MYHGSVDVPKSKINEFFTDAQELQIRGLRGDSNNESPKEDMTNRKQVSKSYPSSKIGEVSRMKKRLKMETEDSELTSEFGSQDISDINRSAEEVLGSSLKRARRLPPKTNLKTDLDDNYRQSYGSESMLNGDQHDR